MFMVYFQKNFLKINHQGQCPKVGRSFGLELPLVVSEKGGVWAGK